MLDSARRFVFHVGSAPTASWVTQQCLEKNAKSWRDRGMYCLPNKVLNDDIGSGDQLIEDPTRLAEVIRTAFADPGVAVVAGSREVLGSPFGGAPGAGLHADAEPAVQALAEATRASSRTIVLSVCPPDELIELHFSRALAAGGSATVAEWIGLVDLDNLSWLPLHRTLCAAFGNDAVEVVEFHPTEAGHAHWLRAFFVIAGVDLSEAVVAMTPSPAVRLSEQGVRLAVAANPHLASNRERSGLREFLQRHFSEFDGPAVELMTAAQKTAARERYDADLDQLTATAGARRG